MAQPKRSFIRRLHDYFLPHRGNGYKPHVFRTASITAILIAVIVLEGAYLAQIHLVFPKTNFLASVLPGTLIALTNDDRAAVDAPALTEDPALDQAATLAAEDMASKGYFAHVSPSGTTPWDWLAQVGYEYTYAGENLAVNFTDSSAVENAWMASPTHHANIVKPQYSKVGVGVADGTYQGQQVTFVVQFFATPAGAPVVQPTDVAVAKPAPVTTVKLPVAAADVVPTTTTVLAASTTPPPTATASSTVAAPGPSLLDRALTSPTHTSVLILSILAGLVLVLLIIAIVVKLQVQYIEVIGGGLLLLVVLIGLALFNMHSAPKVELPSNVADSATAK